MIPKKVFTIWRKTSDLGWNISAWLETLHSLRWKKNSTGKFSRQFLFLIGYQLLSETFSNFWQNFSEGLSLVQSTCPGEDSDVKLIFFSKNLWNVFFRILGRKLCPFPANKFPQKLSKMPCSLPDEHFQRSDFLGKTFIFVVLFGFWAGKFRQGCQKMVYVDRRMIEESGFYFKWFDSRYCFLTLNKTFRILAENFQQGC